MQKEQGLKFEKDLSKVESPTLRNINGTIWVQDSSYSYSFNDGNEYLNYRMKVFARDEFGHAIVEMNHFWDDNTQNWINRDTIITSHYNANQQNKYFSRPWNTELQEWADTSYYSEFTTDGALLLSHFSTWDYNNNEFLSRSKYRYILDEFGNDSYEIRYDWNNNVQEWKLDEKWSYTYDISGNIIQKILQFWVNGTNTWANKFQYINTYNDNGKLMQVLFQIWSNETSTWNITSTRFINYDDNGNETQTLYQDWDVVTSAWINTSQQLYNYDDNGNRLHFLRQYWNIESNSWDNNWQSVFSYDFDDKLTHELYQD